MSSVKNSMALLKSLGLMKMEEQEENDNQSKVVELQDVTKDLFKTLEKGRNKRTFSDMLNGEKEQLAVVENFLMQRPNDDEEEDLPDKATVLLSLGIEKTCAPRNLLLKLLKTLTLHAFRIFKTQW